MLGEGPGYQKKAKRPQNPRTAHGSVIATVADSGGSHTAAELGNSQLTVVFTMFLQAIILWSSEGSGTDWVEATHLVLVALFCCWICCQPCPSSVVTSRSQEAHRTSTDGAVTHAGVLEMIFLALHGPSPSPTLCIILLNPNNGRCTPHIQGHFRIQFAAVIFQMSIMWFWRERRLNKYS